VLKTGIIICNIIPAVWLVPARSQFKTKAGSARVGRSQSEPYVTHDSFDKRAFSVAGSTAPNSLPADMISDGVEATLQDSPNIKIAFSVILSVLRQRTLVTPVIRQGTR